MQRHRTLVSFFKMKINDLKRFLCLEAFKTQRILTETPNDTFSDMRVNRTYFIIENCKNL